MMMMNFHLVCKRIYLVTEIYANIQLSSYCTFFFLSSPLHYWVTEIRGNPCCHFFGIQDIFCFLYVVLYNPTRRCWLLCLDCLCVETVNVPAISEELSWTNNVWWWPNLFANITHWKGSKPGHFCAKLRQTSGGRDCALLHITVYNWTSHDTTVHQRTQLYIKVHICTSQ